MLNDKNPGLPAVGAKSNRDDRLCVSLDGAGTSSDGTHPEDGLRLVHNVQDLLRLLFLRLEGFIKT